MYLRQSTAGQEVLLGPFIDDTDGKTAETGLTIANTDIKIWKAGATTEVSKNSGGATHIAGGRYYSVLDATDTDTLGSGEINVVMSGALPVKLRFTVLAANVFDAIVAGSDKLQVDMVEALGTAITTEDGTAQAGASGSITLASGASSTDNYYRYQGVRITGGTGAGQARMVTSYVGSTKVASVYPNWTTAPSSDSTYIFEGVTVVDVGMISGDSTAADNLEAATDGTGYNFPNTTIPTVTTVNGLANNAITASAIASDAITSAKLAADAITAAKIADNAITAAKIASNAITSAKIASDAIGAAQIASDAAGEIADAVWDEAISGHLTSGTTGAALNAAGSAGDPWSTPIPGAYGTGTAGKIVGDNLNATVNSRAAATDLQTLDDVVDAVAILAAAIEAKTANLPASPAAVGSAMTLTTGERDSIAAALLDLANGVETGLTVRQFARAVFGAAAGLSDGADLEQPTNTIHYRNLANNKNRISATTDVNGNRTGVTLDLS